MPDQVVNTICPFCGVGCGIGVRTSDGQITGVEPLQNHPVSRGQLCAKGWNSVFGIDGYNRLNTPLIKEQGRFRPAAWDEALDLIADNFRLFLEENGPESVGLISCARATNEDNYAAQKFARAVLKTNNVDHCARICHSPSVAGLKQTLGSGAMTNSIDDIYQADLIVVYGADPTENHTIIGGHIMRAKLNGAKLLVVDPRRTRLARLADMHIQLNLGTNIALLNGLINIIFENGWENKAFLQERCDNVPLLRNHVREYTPENVSEITGVPVKQLIAAAKLYSHAGAAFLCYGMGITQYASGTNNVIAVSNLVLTCGHIGRPGTGINPLRGQNNVQGACDMGALPDVYPGYQDAVSDEVHARFSNAWGTEVATQAGLTSLGMMTGALDSTFRGMIIIGEDPVVTDPDQNHVIRALRKMDFLVVIELTMTETADLADVVLPAASFAEKGGTFTNCERRVQHVRKVTEPIGQCKPDWVILGKLASRMGYDGMNWTDAEQVFNEMARLNPIYSGMSYAKLDEHHGLQWPCNDRQALGTPILHQTAFPLGKARLIPVTHVGPIESPDEEYPLYFTTNRLHFHYGCGSMTRKSPLLERENPDGLLTMNPEDATALGIVDLSPIGIRSRRGYVETRVLLSEHVPRGLVTMPYHFKEAPSNQITNTAQDPVTKMPELKACAVRIEPLDKSSNPRPITAILER